MGPGQLPEGVLTKEAKIWFTLIVIVLVVLFGILIYLISNFTPPSMLPDSDPIPHSRLSVQEGRIYDLPDAMEYQVLGDASGEQYLAIVALGGSLHMYVSNDTFLSNITWTLLDEAYGTDPATVQLRLGHDTRGKVAVSISRGTGTMGWTLEGWPDQWAPMTVPVEVLVPGSPVVDPSSLPLPENLRDWETGWDTISLEGRDVAVGTYTYQAGCTEEPCSPSVVFVTDDGDWSTIVVLGRQWVDKVRVAGTGLDDMFVVSVEIDNDDSRWFITVVDKDGILDLGQSPPEKGVD